MDVLLSSPYPENHRFVPKQNPAKAPTVLDPSCRR